MLERIAPVQFPAPSGIVVNMMPVIPGDPDSVPEFLRGYLPLMAGQFETNRVAYLTIHESQVAPGQTQRRPGIHTDGTFRLSWGGGGWGGGSPPPPEPPKTTPDGKPIPPDPAAPRRGGAKKVKRLSPSGIFMASSDGRCRAWNLTTWDVDAHGSVQGALPDTGELMTPSTLYWMTDRTPHESLPSLVPHYRQFYRFVSEEVGVWFSRHSTPNPLGVLPTCRITDEDKFLA